MAASNLDIILFTYFLPLLLMASGLILILVSLFIQNPSMMEWAKSETKLKLLGRLHIAVQSPYVPRGFLLLGGVFFLAGLVWALSTPQPQRAMVDPMQKTLVEGQAATATVQPIPTVQPTATVSEPTVQPVTGLVIPLLESFGFEQQADLKPWGSFPKEKNFELALSDYKAHSGAKSLEARVDMEATVSNGYASVGLEKSGYPTFGEKSVAAGEGWIMIPDNQDTKGKIFTAYMSGYAFDADGKTLKSIGKAVTPLPGSWTRVVWQASYSTDLYDKDYSLVGRFISRDRKVNAVYIEITCNLGYSGTIYLDDIAFYGEP